MTEPKEPYNPMLAAIDGRQERREKTSQDFLDIAYLRNRLKAAEMAVRGTARIVREMRALMGMGDILSDVKEAYVEHLHKELNHE